MSKQKQMTKAELAKAKKQRKKLKDAPTEMRSGSFKLPSKDKLKHRQGKLKLTKKQKDKLKIGG